MDPYINTTLKGVIAIKSHQLNNQIYKHIKTELNTKYVNKCYLDYGYIVDILKIDYENITEGEIKLEDTTASTIVQVDFIAKLCKPIENTHIHAKIKQMNKLMLIAENGPIKIIIKNNNINTSIFVFDHNKNEYIIFTNKKILEIDTTCDIKILETKIINNEKHIIVMGYLNDVVTQ